jgi:hypothetical protein
MMLCDNVATVRFIHNVIPPSRHTRYVTSPFDLAVSFLSVFILGFEVHVIQIDPPFRSVTLESILLCSELVGIHLVGISLAFRLSRETLSLGTVGYATLSRPTKRGPNTTCMVDDL